MKKLLSIILVITMTLSNLAIFPTAVSENGTLTFDYDFVDDVVTFTFTGQGTFSDIPENANTYIDIWMEYDPGDLEFIDGSIKFTGSRSADDEFIDVGDDYFALSTIIPYDENGYMEASVSISYKVLRVPGETFVMYGDYIFGSGNTYTYFEGDEWEDGYITLIVPSLCVNSGHHSYSEWIIDTDADCTSDGKKHKICSTCGDTVTGIIPAHGHSYSEWIIDTDSDCTSDGKKHKVCSICGDTVTGIIPALGHSYSEWVQNSGGMYERECSTCGNKEILSGLIFDYDFVGDVVTFTFTGQGTFSDIPENANTYIDIYMEYDPGDLEFIDGSIEFTGSKSANDEFIDVGDGYFSLGARIPYDENGYMEASVSISYKVLRGPGETFAMYGEGAFGVNPNYIYFGDTGDITLTVPSHSYSEWIIDTDADCTSDGKKHKVCSICGDTVTEIIPALGHSYSEWVQNSGGMYERECSTCGNKEILSGLIFDYEFEGDVVTFTFTGQGTFSDIPEGQDPFIDIWMEYDPGDLEFIDGSIKFTGSKSADDEFIDVGDGYFSLGAIIPYDENGYAEASVSISYKVLRGPGETFAMYGEGAFGVNFDYIYFGEDGDITLTVPSHSYSEWIIDTDADCTSDGKKHKVCSICGDTVTEIIPALGHSYSEWIQNSEGMYERECSACGNTEIEANPIISSGTCGNNLTWELFSDGTLEIMGTGSMTDYSSSSSVPWYSNRSSIKKVIIESGVTSISKYAFYNCSSLTSVTMGDSVTSIGYDAFSGCSSLVKVYITDIEKWCGISFYNSGSNPLCNGANLYLNNELVKDITIPDGITGITDYAFYNCSSLTSVTMPDSVTSIGSYAFRNCSSLVKVYITDITKWCGISFYDFDSNPLCNGANLYLNNELIKDLTIPGEVTEIKDFAFEGCSSLTSVTIGDSVTSIGDVAFYSCSSLTSVTIPDSVTSIGSYAFSYCSSLTSVTIPDSVTSIGSYAFYNCSSLTSVTIPDSVTSIGDCAFSGCSSLTSVTIPDSVTSIGKWAFSDCSGLTSVTIPDSVTSISERAFSGCSSLESVYITSLESWCNISFYDYDSNPLYPSSNSKLYLNGEVITHLDIPVGITKINNDAFRGAECITSVVIPEGVEVIGSSAFCDCNNIETVTIPQSTVKIFDYAFYNCFSLKKVYYAGSADDWAEIIIDSDNDYLENAEIIYGVNIEGGEDEEETVSYIAVGNLGTAEWALLENGTVIINGTGVPSVNELPFYKYRDTITAVKISEGITAIPEDMFYKCSNITSVIIPASVTKIGDSAFWRCDAITDVYYCGTEAQWANIQIDEYNDILSSCAFTYNYSPVTVKAFKTLTKPQKVTYAYGEELEVDDMHVAVFYSNNSFKEVEDFTVSGYDKCTFGRQEVTVSYEDQSFTMDVYVKPTEPSVLTTPMKAGMTVKEFSAPYSMLYTVCVFDDSMSKQLSDEDIITSGCVVQFVRDEKLMDSIGIVVSGDATCDGIVNGKDLIRIKKQINSGDAVEYTEYADINCDGIIDDADLVCLVSMISG